MIGEYQIIKTIGKGNFSVVKLAVHHRLGIQVAIKIVNKTLFDEPLLMKIRREIQAMKKLSHQYIIKLYQILETDSKIYLVMEYANGGEIFEQLQIRERYSESEARELFWQMVCAINFCHNLGVVHRDLKVENLLLVNGKNQIKIADFGFCNFFDFNSPISRVMNTHCGSPQYAAPELFRGDYYDGTKADIWSLGVILYILVCGRFPFAGDSLAAIRSKVLLGHLNFQFYVSENFCTLVRSILKDNPKERFTLPEIVDSPWMKSSTFYHKHIQTFNQLPGQLSIGRQHLTNHIVDIMVRQYGYSQEEIIFSINNYKFDSNFAAYQILYDKFLESAESLNLSSGTNLKSSPALQSIKDEDLLSNMGSSVQRLSSSVPETVLNHHVESSRNYEEYMTDQEVNSDQLSTLEECSWNNQSPLFFLETSEEQDCHDEDRTFDPASRRLCFKLRGETFSNGAAASGTLKRRHTLLPGINTGPSHFILEQPEVVAAHTMKFPVDRRASMGSHDPNALDSHVFRLQCFPHMNECSPDPTVNKGVNNSSNQVNSLSTNQNNSQFQAPSQSDELNSPPANQNNDTLISLASTAFYQPPDKSFHLCGSPVLPRTRLYQKRASLPAQMILPQLPEVPPQSNLMENNADSSDGSLNKIFPVVSQQQQQQVPTSLVRHHTTLPGSLDVRKLQSELQTLSMQYNLAGSKVTTSTLSDLSEGYFSEKSRDTDSLYNGAATSDQSYVSNSSALSSESGLTDCQAGIPFISGLLNSCQYNRKQDQFSQSPPNHQVRYGGHSHPYHHGRRRSSPSATPFYHQLNNQANFQFSSANQERGAPFWPHSSAQSNQELNDDDLVAIQKVNEKIRKEYKLLSGGGLPTASNQSGRRGSFQTASLLMPLPERERRPSDGELVLMKSCDSLPTTDNIGQ